MKERPILFSAPMVRAMLAGTKTQTRRAVSRGNSVLDWDGNSLAKWGGLDLSIATAFSAQTKGAAVGSPAGVVSLHALASGLPGYRPGEHTSHRIYPRWRPGDRLWVKETFSPFRIHGGASDIMRADYVVLKDGAQVYTPLPGGGQRFFAPLKVWGSGAFDHIRWRPSIHMPRWASRITLEITDVRVQRLHEITDEDAKAEGITEAEAAYERDVYPHDSYRRAYSALWDRINGPGAWASNPWVWALTFKRVQP